MARRCRATPCFACFYGRPFSYLLLFLGSSLGGFEGTNRGSFRLGLALKTPIGRNKVVRLGFFWVVFWIQAYGFHLHQSFKIKFLFPVLSLFITCLFLFLLFHLVDLVYV